MQLLADVFDALEPILVVLWIECIGEHDVIPAAAGFDQVGPARRRTGRDLFLEAHTHLRILEAFQTRLRALLPDPIGHRDIEARAARGIDIHVCRDVHAARTRRFDELTRLRHQFPPARRIGSLEMENFDLDAGFLTDFYGLADGLQQLGALIAHVAGIDATVFRGDARKLDEIFGALKTVRWVNHRRGDTQSAG